jgi:DUF917 family protein
MSKVSSAKSSKTFSPATKIGARLVGQERLVDPAHLSRAVWLLEEFTGKASCAVMSVEIGGGNALSPFLAGAMLDLPVVDADAMGRASPQAKMTSFATDDLQMYPLALIDCRENEADVARAASWTGWSGSRGRSAPSSDRTPPPARRRARAARSRNEAS